MAENLYGFDSPEAFYRTVQGAQAGARLQGQQYPGQYPGRPPSGQVNPTQTVRVTSSAITNGVQDAVFQYPYFDDDGLHWLTGEPCSVKSLSGGALIVGAEPTPPDEDAPEGALPTEQDSTTRYEGRVIGYQNGLAVVLVDVTNGGTGGGTAYTGSCASFAQNHLTRKDTRFILSVVSKTGTCVNIPDEPGTSPPVPQSAVLDYSLDDRAWVEAGDSPQGILFPDPVGVT